MKLMLTCEHASNRLPASFKKAIPADVLKTHRAYDIGACAVFRKLVRFAKPEFYSEGKFSRLTKAKAQASDYWKEYRAAIENFVESALKSKSKTAKSEPAIVHLGIHSFTPVLNGKVRCTDIGILYDPSRPQERAYANVIKDEIKRLYPAMKVRFNYPYKGTKSARATWESR